MKRNLKYHRLEPADAAHPLSDLFIKADELEDFVPTMLGLRDLNSESVVSTALAAMFDLEGFTHFASQTDPQLVVSSFLDDFLSWLFATIRNLSIEKQQDDKTFLHCSLPFFAKFMGDGVFFLWDIDYEGIAAFCKKTNRNLKREVQGDVGNIISILYDVCQLYWKEFAPKAAKLYSRVPARLRCGIAQGHVFSVGGGSDYVGPCINMAARLQKLGRLGFAILQRGIDLEMTSSPELAKILMRKKAPIRGSGDELILIIRKEFEALTPEEQDVFQDP